MFLNFRLSYNFIDRHIGTNKRVISAELKPVVIFLKNHVSYRIIEILNKINLCFVGPEPWRKGVFTPLKPLKPPILLYIFTHLKPLKPIILPPSK